MKKKILVTGGTGFIGSAICNFFSNKGYSITILDNNSRGKTNRIKKSKNINIIKGDIKNYDDVYKSALVQIVYSTLQQLMEQNSFMKPDEVLDVSCKGIINVIDVAKKLKIKNIFLASSSEVYHLPNKIPTDETEPLKIPNVFNSRYSYSGGKILTELLGINNAKFLKKW